MNFLNALAVGAVAGSDAALQLNNVEVIYSRVQRVYVKPQHKEERQRELRVNVEIHAGLSPVCRKVIPTHYTEAPPFPSLFFFGHRSETLYAVCAARGGEKREQSQSL